MLLCAKIGCNRSNNTVLIQSFPSMTTTSDAKLTAAPMHHVPCTMHHVPCTDAARYCDGTRLPYITTIRDGVTPSTIPAFNNVHKNFIVANYAADGE